MADGRRAPGRGLLLIPLAAAVLAAALLGLALGSAPLTLGEVLEGLFGRERTTPHLILWAVRLPRVAAALLAGAGLAVSGVLLQAATNNPLAGPNVIGVNAGAGFTMILGMCLFPLSYQLLPAAAFVGAFACTALIVAVSAKAGGSKVTIVLAGVAVSTLLNAGISLLKLVYPDMTETYTHFSVGDVDGVTFPQLAAPAAIIAGCLLAAMVLGPRLDLLCLGDALAASLGVRVKPLRAAALLLASASAAAAVSFSGLLGFVGLMVPHIARRLVGTDLRRLLPAATLLGAALVTVSDLIGRVVFAPSQVPAGIITSFVGVPFFFVLLLQRRDRMWT